MKRLQFFLEMDGWQDEPGAHRAESRTRIVVIVAACLVVLGLLALGAAVMQP